MDLSQIHEDALVMRLPWQVVTVVTVGHVLLTGKLYFDVKVLQMDLSERTQELHKLPPRWVAEVIAWQEQLGVSGGP